MTNRQQKAFSIRSREAEATERVDCSLPRCFCTMCQRLSICADDMRREEEE